MLQEIDYSKTVNLPKTNFSMKANLAQKEPQIIKFWQENKIYEKILKNNEGKKIFVLHDGPPYANGHIHIGHALNKILKDIIVKYRSLQGYYSPYIPGWDCHGLPIEYQLLKELKITKDQISQVEFRKKAKDYAQKYVDIQKDEFIRLGVLGEWDNPYLTMNPSYERNIISTLKKLSEEGYIIKRKKPVYWCIHCETSLAEAEVEYEDKTSDSIFVKFPIKKSKLDLKTPLDKTYILIWTTTPWTLPANLALAIKPDARYVVVENNNEYLIFIKTRLEEIQKILGKELKIIDEFYGLDIADEDKEKTTLCNHPFIDRISYCIPYENVAIDEGTGVIHIAPGHGEEDYHLGIKYNLEIYSPVDNKGKFADEKLKNLELKIFAEQVFKANSIIIGHLKQKGLLLHSGYVQHSYPHCWRCKKPVIFRATEQWFLVIDHKNLRQKLLNNIKSVKWVPEYGENRISSMVELRPDWCLSRQRYWGVPIPAVYCKSCGEVHLKKEILEKVEEIFSKEGSDSWFVRDIKDFIPDNFSCERCGSKEFKKETDILDVWYDSSVSYKILYTSHSKPYTLNLSPKNIMYLEGSDQHRGWFQVALIVSSACDSTAPYSIVLTHGFVVDGEGRKMSKSLGNVVSPQDIIKHHGAEILRLWAASSDYSEDVRISKEILDRLIESYRKIRNTIRYILGNLCDFNTNHKECKFDFLDEYILSRLSDVVEEIVSAYEEYKFYKVINIINNFFIKELSNFYFDILKDKLYTYKKDSPYRRGSQFVLYKIFTSILPLLSPILSFTSEEAWQEAKSIGLVEKESIFLQNFYFEELKKFKNSVIEEEMQKILELRNEVNLGLEQLRKENLIGSSLEAEVELKIYSDELKKIIEKYFNLLKQIFIVSSVKVEYCNNKKERSFEIKVNKFNGIKCPRCWVYYEKLTEKGICEKCKDAVFEEMK